MSRGHLLDDRGLVARLVPQEACFCNDHTGAAPLGGRPVRTGAVVSDGEDF